MTLQPGTCSGMPVYDLFNDTSTLPRTVRGDMPYEVEALSPKEMWGHGHGTTTLTCRQTWDDAATWIRYMVGEAKVKSTSSVNPQPVLVREVPERLRYKDAGNDQRIQWCTGVTQIEQGGNPPLVVGQDPSESDETFSHGGTNWPRAAWIKYQAVWETTPYFVRTLDEIIDMETAAGEYAGARELMRYVVRNRRAYSKEQPIPAASTAGGFKDTTTGRPIGQVGFRVVCMADVVYKWVGVPVGWPPYPGWLITDPANPWPPPTNPGAAAPGTNRPLRESMLGRANSTYFDCADPEGYCWQPEELLYIGFDEYRYYDAAGDRRADYTFNFKFKEGGWNKFLNALGNWVTVTLDGTATGTKPYSTFDFNNLFRWSAA